MSLHQFLSNLKHAATNQVEALLPGAGGVIKSWLSLGRSSFNDGPFWQLLINADAVVKLVLLLLVLLSIISWGVILQKYFLLKKLHQRADRFDEIFWSGIPMEELFQRIGPTPKDPLSVMFSSAMNELLQGSSTVSKMDRVLRAALGREASRLEKNLGILATTSSVAPFIGLFGTVWGIINAFSAIASRGQTSLSVVAPGIAEALFATAVGLIAAIPATMAYNKFTLDIEEYLGRLETFIDEFPVVLQKSMRSHLKSNPRNNIRTTRR
ncbi:MAG: protein TolQ [Hydrotalea sp.]|nr:protein TolQ [Hydrotalea sp.]